MHKFYDNPAERTASTEARVAARLEIGGVAIAPATVLAPMAGVTDTVFRRFIREMGGCGLIMTEFTSAEGVLRGKDRKAKRYLHFYNDEHPISAQLFGSNPESLAEAARILAPGVYVVMHNEVFPIEHARKDREKARFVWK